jgi:ferredoxin-nitrite reductase
MRERVEARLGRALEDYTLPPLDAQPANHLGVREQKQDGLVTVGVPVHLGLVNGDQLLAIAQLAEDVGGDIRLTRQQNLVVTGVPADEASAVTAELEGIGFPLEVNGVRGNSIACTGEPHCNFSVTETKSRLGGLIVKLEERFGDRIADLRLNLDGCPHACAQHWIGDLGFQATTGKDSDGNRIPAYDVFVRGGRDRVGTSLFRRVPSEELEPAVEGLLRGWLDEREPGESFPDFQLRLSDEELGALAGLEPVVKRKVAA